MSVPLPPYPVDSRCRYRARPRPQKSFNTILDAADLLDPAVLQPSTVEIQRQDQAIEIRIEHPLLGGVIREELLLADSPEGLRAVHLRRTVDDPKGARSRDETVDFANSAWPLPPGTYPETAVPLFLGWQPFDGKTRDLYSWINDRFVARVQYFSKGECSVSLPGGKARAIEVMMFPDINDWVKIGKMLSRLVRPFMPKYHMWYELEPPHRLLRFEGAYGPPGAPEIILERVEDEDAIESD